MPDQAAKLRSLMLDTAHAPPSWHAALSAEAVYDQAEALKHMHTADASGTPRDEETKTRLNHGM